MSPRWLSLAQSGRIHAQGLKLSKFGSLGPDNSDTFVSSPHQETISVIGTGQRREPSRTTPRPTSSAAVQRPVGRLRPRKGGANRPAAIQLGGGVNFRVGAVAGPFNREHMAGRPAKKLTFNGFHIGPGDERWSKLATHCTTSQPLEPAPLKGALN